MSEFKVFFIYQFYNNMVRTRMSKSSPLALQQKNSLASATPLVRTQTIAETSPLWAERDISIDQKQSIRRQELKTHLFTAGNEFVHQFCLGGMHCFYRLL